MGHYLDAIRQRTKLTEARSQDATDTKEPPLEEPEDALADYPSDPAELLEYLRSRGFPPVIDETVGGRLCIDAQSLPPPELHLVIRLHNAELRALLRRETNEDTP